MPSEPLVPKPPGTKIPLYFDKVSTFPLIFSESIQSIEIFFPIDAAACFSA